MTRSDILAQMQLILRRQGKSEVFAEDSILREIGFRSLDFSELALRVEELSGKALTFDAGPLRGIRTVKDVLDFLESCCGSDPVP